MGRKKRKRERARTDLLDVLLDPDGFVVVIVDDPHAAADSLFLLLLLVSSPFLLASTLIVGAPITMRAVVVRWAVLVLVSLVAVVVFLIPLAAPALAAALAVAVPAPVPLVRGRFVVALVVSAGGRGLVHIGSYEMVVEKRSDSRSAS